MEIKDIIIIGLGEIGSAWFSILSNTKIEILGIDIKGNKEKKGRKNIKKSGKRIMHICMPFIKDFEKTVSQYIKEYKPDLVIINTSCKVGSARKVYSICKAGNLPNTRIVHIPVRGVHPNIDKGIKTFVSAIGPVNNSSGKNDSSGKMAHDYLNMLGIKSDVFNSSEETEMAKLLDTSYYGWNILFAKQVLELCKEYGLDFDNVYTKFNKSYNDGYKKLGKSSVIRPVLIPPQIFNRRIGIKNNKIDGHCVRTNLEILKAMKKSSKIKFIDYAINLDEIK